MCGEETQLRPRKATKGKEATTEKGREGREEKIENRGGGDEIASARRGPGRGGRRIIGPRPVAGLVVIVIDVLGCAAEQRFGRRIDLAYEILKHLYYFS